MTRFFLTYPIPEAGMSLLRSRGEVLVHGDGPRTPDSIQEGCRDADALVCMLTDGVDAALIEHLNVRAIGTMAVGTNHIDLEAATLARVPVVHTPGVLTEASADLAWALLMAVARRTVEADRFVREDRFRGWEAMTLLGSDLYGKTLGIVGFGRIGQAVARRARGFGMTLLIHSRTPRPELEASYDVERVELDELLSRSDVVSLHTPLTEETEYLFNAEKLAQMKPDAILINTSRGAVVDTEALAIALRTGKIGAAGIDVLPTEPPSPDEPLVKLWREAEKANVNLILTPHTAFYSGEAMMEIRTKAASEVTRALRGEKLINCVNGHWLSEEVRDRVLIGTPPTV